MLKESLNSLGFQYIDLYLIHWPFAFKVFYLYADVNIVLLELNLGKCKLLAY